MKQVLIVDDEARLLKSIEIGLRSYKDRFNVLTAQNGREAVEILKAEIIDLVITDLRMPEMDGFELLAHISATFPFLPSIVMTAFATPEIEERVNSCGTHRLLEKPIDFRKLAEAIVEGLEQESKEGAVAGFSLANFLQLLAMEEKTCLLNIKDENTDGYIYLDSGEITAAISGREKGEEALFSLLACEKVKIIFKKLPKKKVIRMIDRPLMSLLMEGMRRLDEKEPGAGEKQEQEELPATEEFTSESEERQTGKQGNLSGTGQNADGQSIKGEKDMGKLEDCLGKLKDVEGFMAAGVFTPNGEIAAQVNIANIKLAEVGSIANDVLLKAQKATDVMNIGRGNVVHVEAPQAHVIARCLNENTDFSQTEAGKAHVHMVLMLDKDANLAIGKMKLESIISEVAASFR